MLARERALRIALAEANAGVLETGADTDTSPRIKQYQAADSFKSGSSDTGYDWCVSFIVWCYREAGRELTETGRSASVPFTEEKARAQGWVVRKPKRGDIVCIQHPPVDPTPDHIAIVVDVLSNGGARTVEGNTSGEGGSGVHVKTRSKEECETFIRVPGQVPSGIGRGDRGADVKVMQRQLVRLGRKNLEVDGEFGDKTEKALKRFQRRHNLPESGVATARTRAAIERALQPATPPPVESAAPRRRFNVAATFPGGRTKKAEGLHPRTAMNRQVNAFIDAGAESVQVLPTT